MINSLREQKQQLWIRYYFNTIAFVNKENREKENLRNVPNHKHRNILEKRPTTDEIQNDLERSQKCDFSFRNLIFGKTSITFKNMCAF